MNIKSKYAVVFLIPAIFLLTASIKVSDKAPQDSQVPQAKYNPFATSIIDASRFDELRYGMTLNEVQEIVGLPRLLTSSQDLAKHTYVYKSLQNDDRVFISLFFKKDTSTLVRGVRTLTHSEQQASDINTTPKITPMFQGTFVSVTE